MNTAVPSLESGPDRATASASTTREWDLVRAAGSIREADLKHMRSFLEAPLDWQAVLRLADHHRTTELMYRNLLHVDASAELVPAPVFASLQKNSQRNVHKSLFLAREVIRVVACLNGRGIDVMPYKGVVMSEAYYGDLSLRLAGDMDFFVRQCDVARVKNFVRDLGYTLRLDIPHEAEQDYIASGYEYTFDSPAGKNLLELQWALLPRFYAVDFDMGGLFARAVNVSVAGSGVKTPAAEDLLLLLSVHAAKHVWGRLIWLCDIAQILRRENLNWDWVQGQARELGIERILQVTLLLARQLVGAGIPAPVSNAMVRDPAVSKFANQIAAEIASGTLRQTENLSYFRLLMGLRERRIDRLRFLTRLAFTPGPGEWAAVPLPRALFPLYRVVRMARLSRRFAGMG